MKEQISKIKETSVEDLNMFVDAMVAEVQNYSRQG